MANTATGLISVGCGYCNAYLGVASHNVSGVYCSAGCATAANEVEGDAVTDVALCENAPLCTRPEGHRGQCEGAVQTEEEYIEEQRQILDEETALGMGLNPDGSEKRPWRKE